MEFQIKLWQPDQIDFYRTMKMVEICVVFGYRKPRQTARLRPTVWGPQRIMCNIVQPMS